MWRVCFVLGRKKEESQDGPREQEAEWQIYLNEARPIWGRV